MKSIDDVTQILDLIKVTKTVADIRQFRIDTERSLKNSNYFTTFQKAIIRGALITKVEVLTKEERKANKNSFRNLFPMSQQAVLDAYEDNTPPPPRILDFQVFKSIVLRMEKRYSTKFINNTFDRVHIPERISMSRRISAVHPDQFAGIVDIFNDGPNAPTSRHPL